MTALHDQMARSLAAKAVEERLEVLAVLLPTMNTPEFLRQQSEAITNAVLAIWSAALKDLRPNVATGLRRRDNVIGQIGVR